MSATAETRGTLSRLVEALREPRGTVLATAAIYVLWVVITYLLEGRIQTLLRPEATTDRLVYAVVANLLVGTVLALWIVRQVVASGLADRERLGFRSLPRTLAAVVIAAVGGLAMYVLQNPPSTDPIVVANAYAQVLNVSTAEILVCWVVIGATTEALLRKRGVGAYASIGVAIVVASVLFGIYHVGHSPPFNTLSQIVLLSAVGVVTSLVYFVGRDVYATLVFHNFLGVIGVTRALAGGGSLGAYGEPIVPLVAIALVSIVVLVVAEVLLVRRSAVG